MLFLGYVIIPPPPPPLGRKKKDKTEVTLLRQSGSPLPGRRGWGTKNEDDCANRFETLQGDSQRNKMINLQKQRVAVGGEIAVQIGR